MDERKNFAEQGTRLIDSLNRLMLLGALLVFYFLLTPILFKIQKSTEKTAQGIERQDATLDAIREKIGEETWQRNEQRLQETIQK